MGDFTRAAIIKTVMTLGRMFSIKLVRKCSTGRETGVALSHNLIVANPTYNAGHELCPVDLRMPNTWPISVSLFVTMKSSEVLNKRSHYRAQNHTPV